jgi:hypothetical protein
MGCGHPRGRRARSAPSANGRAGPIHSGCPRQRQGAPGQAAYFIHQGDTYLIFNTDYVYHTDSDTDFEFAIRVSGVHTPDASWFV